MTRAQLAQKLNGRSIFVTGGTGFLGKTLLDFLESMSTTEKSRFRVDLLTRDPASFLRDYPRYGAMPWLRLLPGSLASMPPPSVRYTDVIHAAGSTHLDVGHSQWITQIVEGTRSALEFAKQSGASRFLFTSSGAIYGTQPPELDELDENYNGAPPTNILSSVYGQAKRVAEQLCAIYFHEYGLETIIARCFAFSGTHIPLDGPYAIGNFIRDAKCGNNIKIRGDGTAIRTYLDGDDMARWLMTLLQYGRPGEAYNVGSDQPVSMLELATLVAAEFGGNKAIIVESNIEHGNHRSRYVPCIRKAETLGLSPIFNLRQVIRRSGNAEV